jgi:hypothetical protein
MQLQRRPSGLPDWLYIAIMAALGLYFVIGAITWATFIYNGIPVPANHGQRRSPGVTGRSLKPQVAPPRAS